MGPPPSPPEGEGKKRGLVAKKRQFDVATTRDLFFDQSAGDRRWCCDFGSPEIRMSRYYAREVTVVMSLLRCNHPATAFPKFSVFFVSNYVSFVEAITTTTTLSLTHSDCQHERVIIMPQFAVNSRVVRRHGSRLTTTRKSQRIYSECYF